MKESVDKVLKKKQWRLIISILITVVLAIGGFYFLNYPDGFKFLSAEEEVKESAFLISKSSPKEDDEDDPARDEILKYMYKHSKMPLSILTPIYEKAKNTGNKVLVLAIIKAESNYNPMAQSKHAIGLMGIGKINLKELKGEDLVSNIRDLYDTNANINSGLYLFKKYFKLAKGNLELALKYYNCGPNNKETLKKTDYHNKVLKNYATLSFIEKQSIKKSKDDIAEEKEM